MHRGDGAARAIVHGAAEHITRVRGAGARRDRDRGGVTVAGAVVREAAAGVRDRARRGHARARGHEHVLLLLVGPTGLVEIRLAAGERLVARTAVIGRRGAAAG